LKLWIKSIATLLIVTLLATFYYSHKATPEIKQIQQAIVEEKKIIVEQKAKLKHSPAVKDIVKVNTVLTQEQFNQLEERDHTYETIVQTQEVVIANQDKIIDKYKVDNFYIVSGAVILIIILIIIFI